MKKQSSIFSSIIPSWMKFRKVAEPIRVRKIRDVLDDLLADDGEVDSKIKRVISKEDRDKETQIQPPVEETPDARDNTHYINAGSEKKKTPSVLDKMQNKITSVSDDLKYNLAKDAEENAKNSEKTDKNAENSGNLDENTEIKSKDSSTLKSSNNSDNDLEKEEKSKELTEFEKEIQKIQDSYNGVTDYDYYKDLIPEIKDSLGLTELENPEIDEDALRNEITNRLTKNKNEEKSKLKESAEDTINKLMQSLASEKENAQETKDNLSKVYDDAKENVSMDALKRGLQRSSIVLQKVSELDSKKAENLINIQNNLEKSLTEGNNKIKSLEQMLDESLANADTELAEEIEAELAGKIEKLKEKKQEIEKFNNNVKKLEAEYQLKIASKKEENQELEKKLAEEYKGVASKNRKNELVDACKEYFKDKTRSEALNELKNSEVLKDVLGERYHDVYYYITKTCK